MRILYVITGLAQGGAERVVCDLADKMHERNHQVKIVYLTGDVLTRPVHSEIEIIKLGLSNIFTLPNVYYKLSRTIKSYEPDVVHSHMVHANILSRLVRITTPMNRLISTAHSNNEGGRIRMMAYRLTHNLANLTTNVSISAAKSFEYMKAVPKQGIEAIYNGIDLDKFKYISNSKKNLRNELNINSEDKIILAVGRFNEAKNYIELLEAIRMLKQQDNESFKLLIAGDGELRDSIQSTILNLNIQENVILLGRRDDIPELMNGADLFVLASKYEGFGLVVAEAMACKCLVVATDCGGVAEVLDNEPFLIYPINPEKISEKINFALNLSNNQRDQSISKNYNRVQSRFSLTTIVDKWVALYNEN